jgi:hypothetical protein
MANSINQAFTKSKIDELYTPKILVECIRPYFEKWAEIFLEEHNKGTIHVWMPFDTEYSEFNFFFQDYPYVIPIISHIDKGEDFFTFEPKEYDIIISNPPFSKKLKVFKRLNDLQEPYVMIMNTMALNYMEIGNYFANNPIQLLIPDKRVSFDGNPSSFNSCYVCKDFLEKDLIFCHVDHCNSGKNYIPSRMYTTLKKEI